MRNGSSRSFKEWGFDAHIETFDVLFPTPKERLLEMLKPTAFRASLQEPPIAEDPTSSQTSEQLPTYNAYSADGDVTAPWSTSTTAIGTTMRSSIGSAFR